MTKASSKKTCKVCGAERFPNQYHAHCSGCGVVLGSGLPHDVTCARLDLPSWAYCPVCKKLLAAGAFCPEHGDPLEK